MPLDDMNSMNSKLENIHDSIARINQ